MKWLIVPALAMVGFGLGSESIWAGEERFYVGCYTVEGQTGGIMLGRLDAETGKISALTLAVEAESPSHLAVSADGKFVYAALEQSGQVAAYRVEGEKLVLLNERSSEGKGPCHVYLGAGSLFVSNYSDGKLACFPVEEDGSLGEVTSRFATSGSGPDAKRQTGPHAHGMIADREWKFAYACDLGTDRVWAFALDQGKMTEIKGGSVKPGAGPRHMAWGKDEKYLYVVNEMLFSVTPFEKQADGSLKDTGMVGTLPEGIDFGAKPDGAEIVTHPTGQWLYVSIRGIDCLAVFRIEGNGGLSFVEVVPARVKIPRGFGIDGSGRWLIVAGQKSNSLEVFAIDPETGKLRATGERVETGSPTAVEFVK